MTEPTFSSKLKWNLPWLMRYPLSRAMSWMGQTAFERKSVVITIADHFEPGWSPSGVLDHKSQMTRLKAYHKLARETGEAVRDIDGTKFRHTNFYPAEQYHPEILDIMAEMQAEGLGEVEVHLHHGVERPDTSENLRRVLIDFRDTLAGQHSCLSQMNGEGEPRYAYVHGNLALANSCGGRFCGVDDEMSILQETGCYADMTLPSAPDQSQVPIINQIYECGGKLDQAVPHRIGRRVSVNGIQPVLPLIFTGPLVFNWTRRWMGIPVPRIDDGALAANQPMDIARFNRWKSANITVAGRPDIVFVKLYCHGFFDHDQSHSIGDDAKRFFNEIIEYGEKEGQFDVYFASAREAFNITLAAIDGKRGRPGEYRDYRLKSIMQGT
ncbi:MAG: hypothetical protein KA746_09810 [Pyrinomonadaceae bacterium]|nr:hypothetical protein [Pyrinomonadaceae bacterium]MBP6212046.1 hypothetical protein [Pyrinomonadaceae bacterium]